MDTVKTDGHANRTESIELESSQSKKRRPQDVAADVLRSFERINVWGVRDKRAPHKPLLALWAIGRCLRGEPRLAPYQLVEDELESVLRRFGPHRSRIRTDYPFWHMRNDNIWEVDRPSLVRTTSKNSAYVGDLKRYEIRGGFKQSIYDALFSDLTLSVRIADNLVTKHFPPSLQDAVLEDTVTSAGSNRSNLNSHEKSQLVRRRVRDPNFRRLVLAAYGARCAVCAFRVRLKKSQ